MLCLQRGTLFEPLLGCLGDAQNVDGYLGHRAIELDRDLLIDLQTRERERKLGLICDRHFACLRNLDNAARQVAAANRGYARRAGACIGKEREHCKQQPEHQRLPAAVRKGDGNIDRMPQERGSMRLACWYGATSSSTMRATVRELETRMPGRVEGKVALIVGAGCVGPGWGNGRAAAVLFAREGAKVFAVDKDADSMSETVARVGNDGEIATHVCDVLDDAQVTAMAQACQKKFGRIDILVNNVGGSAAGGAAEISEENFDKQIDYNLKSVFLTCRHVIPVMVEQGGGAIVNTASSSGIRYTGSPQIGYAAAKAAVIQFSRVTAVQYARNGIRVNTVIPGQMHTPMVEARLAKQRAGGDVEALLKSRVARIPLGFMGDGRDTAAAVLFLASDEARFITGTEIVVDGGMTARCD